MTEVWKWIPGYEVYYQVSNKGRIRSVDRKIYHPQGPMRRKGALMKQRLVKGYQMVCLSMGKREHMTVHKAVLLAFPRGVGDQSRHLDGNRLNNHASNLMWGTATENAADRYEHGTYSHGERRAKSVINDGTVRLIRSLHSTGYRLKDICHLVNWDKSPVSAVANRHTWKHVVP